MAKATVLLVDDEEDFTAALAERMEARGLQVDVSSNGPDAIRQVEDRSYDAVILDLAMPGMNGIETLKEMLAKKPDLQVILLTGRATVREGVDAMASGAIEVLEKPADLKTLLDHVEKAKETRVLLAEERAQETISDILRKKGW
jgi:DNA-binding NtrC family response regulator